MEIKCPGCEQLLRLNDADVGKQARCPKCQTVFSIPGEPLAGDEPGDSASSLPDSWFLKIDDGRIFGPVPKLELDQWMNEGRVVASSSLRREGESSWVAAASIYPSLRVSMSSGPASNNPYSDANAAYGAYSSPSATPGRSFQEPHRGGMILGFGVVGLVCCCFFGLAAWIMGYGDLKKIDEGRMDPSGRGLTQAGMIIGIVGTLWGGAMGTLSIVVNLLD